MYNIFKNKNKILFKTKHFLTKFNKEIKSIFTLKKIQ